MPRHRSLAPTGKPRCFSTNLSIARRLALVLAALLALSLATSLFAFLTLRQLGAQVTTLVADNLQVERAASDWLRNSAAGVVRSTAIARSSDTSLVDYFAPATAQSTASTSARQKVVEQAANTPEEKALFERVSRGAQGLHRLARRDQSPEGPR